MLRSFASYLFLIGGFASFLRPAFFLDPRIVGGTIVDISQHPYQLSLQRGTQHTCGAAIISNKWAVTAAHCVSLSANRYRLNAGNNDKYKGVYYQVKRIIRHPAYNDLTIDYDIALLEVDGEIRFNDRLQPVKLAENELANGVMVNVTGWGAVQPGGKSSPVLRKVSLPIVDRKTCRNRYKYVRSITDRMICAGYMEGGKDSCQGDSGGPLAANGTLYGIVSWGYKCAQPLYPGVYTNVAGLLWWIKWISGISTKEMSKKIILFFCSLLAYTVNTKSHQYVDIEDYPYHVSIQIAGRHVCSGAFIHESWIMTAASCVFNKELSIISVRVRSSYVNCNSCGNVLEISNVAIHEKFDKYEYFNDIALLKLKNPAEFGEKLLPIALPEKENEQIQNGTSCVVTGWKVKPAKTELTTAVVAIINQRTCKERLPSYKPLSEEMLCAVNATRPSERCQGDLGAPLVSQQTLIGILSYGLGCETKIHPGVYTRINSYLSWIFVNSGINYK
ncbi:serine protease 53-like [Nylanderia fulva]|uniref:serine protease 53-like n=1 Tax=Nylanderia fulva TaxID=613905 RepID=UPI0010FB3492|nr:serine protease 53-like [Nylanderia fulva]